MNKIQKIVVDAIKHLIVISVASTVLVYIIWYTIILIQCFVNNTLSYAENATFILERQLIVMIVMLGIAGTIVRMIQKYNPITY